MRSIAFILAFVFIFSACEDKAKPKPAPAPVAAKPKAEGKKSPAKLPNRFEKKKDDYFYNPVGKRDPFRVYSPEMVQGAVASRTPLERYGLGELQLTGIVWGLSDPRALIKAPDGYSYVVRANTRIGRNRGRVSKITKKTGYIEEEQRDPAGKLLVKESRFEIRDKKDKVSGLRYSEDG